MGDERDMRAGHVFHTLDLLRGVAAIAVVARHLNGVLRQWLPGSHLAVDLFFTLSGFVLAHAYATRFAAGLGARPFMRARLIRLYPLYLLGSAMGVAVALLTAAIGRPGDADTAMWVAAVVLMLCFLPAPFFNAYQLYPFNNAAWSLGWELVANWGYVLVATRLTDRRLGVALAVSAGCVAAAAVRYDGLDSGSTVFNWPGGAQRVGYCFLAGVAVHRLWRAGRLARLRLPPTTTALVLLAIFVGRPAGAAPAYDATCALLVFPLLVLAATRAPSARLQPLCVQLGLASYAIYALHAPLVRVFEAVMFRHGAALTVPQRLAIEAAFVLAVVAIGLVAHRRFDAPVRRWLARDGRGTAPPGLVTLPGDGHVPARNSPGLAHATPWPPRPGLAKEPRRGSVLGTRVHGDDGEHAVR